MDGKQLKNSILQWAIQGKLVPQDPNDEPASVLLEKIRAEKKRLIKEGKIKKDKNESIIFRGEDNSYYEKFDDGTVKCIDDEIPFEIPNSWVWCRLSIIATRIIGKTPPRGEHRYWSNGFINWVSISDMNDYSVITKTKEKISKEAFEELFQSRISCSGSLLMSFKLTIGRTSILGIDAVHNEAIITITPFFDENNIIRDYLKYLLPIVSNIGDSKDAIKGKTLNSNSIANLLISLPPINEQKRIVERIKIITPIVERFNLSQLTIDNLNTTIKDKLRKSILQEAIQGKLVPQDPNDEPASVLLERIKAEKEQLIKEKKIKRDKNESVIYKGDDNKYYEQIGKNIKCIDDEMPFEIPQSWNWCRLSTIATRTIGKTPPRGEHRYWSNGLINWVSISDMNEYRPITRTKEKISKEAFDELFHRRISQSGSLLMSFKLTVGRTSILGIDAVHNEAIITIIPFIDENYKFRNYLKYLLPIVSNLGDFKDAIKGKTLNNNSIANLLIPLPPINEQKRIVDKIELLFNQLK